MTLDPINGLLPSVNGFGGIGVPPPNHPRSPLAAFRVTTPREVAALFPKSKEELSSLAEQAKTELLAVIDAVESLPVAHRSFKNSIQRMDDASAAFDVRHSSIGAIVLCHPDAEMRSHARQIKVELSQFGTEHLSGRRVFHIYRDYAEGRCATETLTAQQSYYLEEQLKSFKREGHYLDDAAFERLMDLKKELSEKTALFSKNVADDKSRVLVNREELKGLKDDFIDSLDRDGDQYVLTMDYPVVLPVLSDCEVAETRARMSLAFSNRASPDNLAVLRDVINIRDEIAGMVGYPSHAALQMEGMMAGSPETAETFIRKIIDAATPKAERELALLKGDLHPSVKLDGDGRLQGYDLSFSKERYLKQALNVDEDKLSEYFPMQRTFDGLIKIYEAFFGLNFHRVDCPGMWHDSVQMMEVKRGNKLLGHIAVDLFPREGKYTHACCSMIVPPYLDEMHEPAPAMALVIANFPKPTAQKPSLLKHNQVRTFFHEFGHAIHAVCGNAELPTVAGYNTKLDFVEMPSQILEEWIWEKDILKMLGKHYQTGAAIPDDMIDAKISSQQVFTGLDTLRQMQYASMSLEYYKPGKDKDTGDIARRIRSAILPGLAVSQETHSEANFGHLMGYGAGYYSYMWSKVFALDIFNAIRADKGLLNSNFGSRYIQQVIGRGGSCDPNELVRNFLGREPNEEAFRTSLGL